MVSSGVVLGPSRQTVMATLERLWDTVATPVLAPQAPEGTGDFADTTERQRCRVWWCPTGPLPLLPVHAADHHAPAGDRPHDEVLERAVSSCMPTLCALIRVRRRSSPPTGRSGCWSWPCGTRHRTHRR
ncbi:hypothetical protein ACFYY3_21425 [Streptomyces sp. NPDC001812]|uniref:hypothetical protein n=1 Tax=unclassified Streptomyces TaxID=2593676 RepID=UPI0036A47C24